MRRRLPFPLIVTALVVVVLEAVVRLAAPTLPEPLVWNDHEAQNKAQRMSDLAARGPRVDVVFTGSSSMNAAADPRLLSRLAPGVSAYNAALNGADARSMEWWLDQVVVPRLQPDVVVLGTTSLELNDNGITQRDFFRRLVRSEAGQELNGTLGRLGRVERWLEEHSFLARYRTELRRPATIAKGDPRARAGEVDTSGLLRVLPEFHARPYAIPPEFKRRTEQESYHDFAVGGPQLAALTRIARGLERGGISLVLVRMPVTEDLLDMHPHGAQDYRRFERTLNRFAEAHKVRFVDAAAHIRDESVFVDPIHLNAKGMGRFMQLVTPALRAGLAH